jgi:hypothetical protein
MNDEYLWNRTGNDPEVEDLEKALAVFRYRDATPPAAVQQIAVLSERHRRFRLSFAFAFASFAIIAIAAAVWLRIFSSSSRSENAPEMVFVQESTDAPDVIEPFVEPKLPPKLNPEGQSRPAGNRRRSIAATTAAIRSRPRTKDAMPKDTIAGLTAEERFAYRQLMLALSITSSKLKIVQDAVDGNPDSEEKDSKNQR